MKFEVDFYNRGMHPPHALHSEGHQDSMGLCLYLALIERLAGKRIDLTVLDDVVMSIDHGHRRELCRLLRTQFPDRQFLITTHDEQWARQLRAESVVTRQQCIGLAGWTVETGPRYSYEADLWLRIEALLTQGDVPTAAFHLRRGSEAFYHDACAALQASIRFRSDGGWDLGELYSAASSRLNDLLGKADRAAQSWGKPVPPLVPTNLGILKRAVEANWQDVNGSIHYNRWGELSVQDFRPVVIAFKDLHDAFICPSCQGQLYVTGVGFKPDLLRCPCGMIMLNLERNPNPARHGGSKPTPPPAAVASNEQST